MKPGYLQTKLINEIKLGSPQDYELSTKSCQYGLPKRLETFIAHTYAHIYTYMLLISQLSQKHTLLKSGLVMHIKYTLTLTPTPLPYLWAQTALDIQTPIQNETKAET